MEKQLTFDDLEPGQHAWLECHEQLLVVMKGHDGGYEVCGAWECGMAGDEGKIIELIEKPKSHKDFKLAYLDDPEEWDEQF